MRKRKGSEITETLNSKGGEVEEEEKKGGGFFGCYLLASLSPRHKGHTYIGFTVNPRRRIRQHNGEIRSGAWRTKRKRPWEMVLCIYGFPTNVSALQFEWAWQHPTESLAVRKAAASMKSLSGIANKIKLAYTMLTLPNWQSLDLTVNFFSTKYTKHTAGCPSLPKQMKVQVRPMEELPCYTAGDHFLYENEDVGKDEEECDETCSIDGSVGAGITKATFQNSVDYHNSIDMPTGEQCGWNEENYVKEPWDSPTSKDHRKPSLVNSPLRRTSLANSFSTQETIDDRDMFGLIGDNMAARKKLPTMIADDKDQPQSSLIASCEIEVIDVLTPSSDCKLSLCSKKRRVSSVHSQIIDLTKSPIFVQL